MQHHQRRGTGPLFFWVLAVVCHRNFNDRPGGGGGEPVRGHTFPSLVFVFLPEPLDAENRQGFDLAATETWLAGSEQSIFQYFGTRAREQLPAPSTTTSPTPPPQTTEARRAWPLEPLTHLHLLLHKAVPSIQPTPRCRPTRRVGNPGHVGSRGCRTGIRVSVR